MPISRRPRRLLLAAALAAAWPALAQTRADDLTTLSLEQLLDVKVVGASKYEQKQSEVAASVSVITRAEIDAFGWRTLEQALASLPGLYATYDRQYNYLGTRGFSVPGDFNTRVLVTVNGNRQNDPAFDGGAMGRQLPLDLALVERIEFIPGPGGAVYGQNAMFGVVNIVTRSGRDLNGVELALGAASPQREREARLSWGAKLGGDVDLLLSATTLRARGEDRFFDYGAAGVSGVAAGLDGRRDKEFFVRVSSAAWSFDYQHGDHRKDDPTGAYLSDPLVAGQYQGDRYDIAHAQWSGDFADRRLSVSARVFAGREHYDSRLSYGTFFAFPATARWHGAEARLLWTGWRDHKLMLGVEAQSNAQQDQFILDLSDAANDIRILNDGWRAGVYMQDEWQLTPTLAATLGFRFDRNDTTGSSTSPRAALIWQAGSATTLKALYGRAHRAPNVYEREYDDGFAQVANPALRGERVDTLEAVADHRVGADLALRAAAYRWTMHDLVVLGLDPVSGLPQYQSGPRINARGLELSAARTWRGGVRLRGSASFQRVTDAGGSAMANSPRRLLRANLSAPLPWAGLRAGVEWRHDSERLAIDGSRIPGFGVANLHLHTGALAKGLGLGLTVTNVFDRRYAQPGADINWQTALEQDGRSLLLELNWRY